MIVYELFERATGLPFANLPRSFTAPFLIPKDAVIRFVLDEDEKTIEVDVLIHYVRAEFLFSPRELGADQADFTTAKAYGEIFPDFG